MSKFNYVGALKKLDRLTSVGSHPLHQLADRIDLTAVLIFAATTTASCRNNVSPQLFNLHPFKAVLKNEFFFKFEFF